MTSNTVLLQNFIAKLEEAKNTLCYTLLLPISAEDFIEKEKCTNKDFTLIDAISEFTYDNCSVFLNENQFHIYGIKEYDCPNLTALSQQPYFWKKLFKQEALLSCFIKLRKLLGASVDLTNYKYVKLNNVENPNFPEETNSICHGFDYLLSNSKEKKPYIELTTNNGSISVGFNSSIKKAYVHINNNLNPPETNRIISSTASNLKNRISTLLQNCDNEFDFSKLSLSLSSEKNADSTQCALHLMEFYNRTITQRKYGKTHTIIPLVNAQKNGQPYYYDMHQEYLSSVQNLLEDLQIPGFFTENNTPSENKHRLLLSDKIYLLYQIETVFAPIAINCMYQLVKPTQNTTLALDDQATINALSSFMRLPNVFSRSYILQMFTDTLTKNDLKNIKSCGFFSRYYHDPSAVMFEFPEVKRPRNVNLIYRELLDNFFIFTSYLESFFFPVYESYIFCTLWDYIEKEHNTLTVGDKIIYMYNLLKDYLNNEYHVRNLFSLDDVSCSYLNSLKLLTKDSFITPLFNINDTSDLALYKRCIMGNKIANSDIKVPPEFISKDYIVSLSSMLKKRVQSLYVVSSIS